MSNLKKRLLKHANYKIINKNDFGVTIEFPIDEAKQFKCLFEDLDEEENIKCLDELDKYLQGKIPGVDINGIHPEYEYLPRQEQLDIFW